MDVLINDVDGYVDNWLRFQSLWDLNMDLILESLGQDIGSWMECLKVASGLISYYFVAKSALFIFL